VLEGQPALAELEQAHRRPGGAPALGRAAGVKDLEVALDLVQGKVAVAEDDGGSAWEALAQAVQPPLGRAGVVGYGDGRSTHLDLEHRGKRALQLRLVDVAVHGVDDRTERSNFLQRRDGEEIAGVDHRLGRADGLDAALRQATASPRHVGVGENGDQGSDSGGCAVVRGANARCSVFGKGRIGNSTSVAGIAERQASGRSALPAAGPICDLVTGMLSTLRSEATPAAEPAEEVARLAALVDDPLGDDDLQLALYLCFELHYRSFPGVDPDWEWDPTLLGLRAVLEETFFDALEAELGPWESVDPALVGELLFRLESEDDGVSLSRHLESQAGIEEFREFVVHRSFYQLKESDPHSWAIPRLDGPAKTALLEVQADEYGGGRPERMHSRLFAKTMRALGLDDRENAYLHYAPGKTLATVNLMSATGLRRSRRGAIVGHLAMFEMTSAQPNRRYGNALRRLGFDAEATDFYDEHVEADAVHENIAAYDLAGGLARQEPELADDILFGARALLLLEDRLARHLLEAWGEDRTSLRRALGSET
jgi:hypothetical protein